MKEKRAAILTVFDAPVMTKRGRKRIAAWLRKQAEFLEMDRAVWWDGDRTLLAVRADEPEPYDERESNP